MLKFNVITLTEGPGCKCSCGIYKGSDNKNYWYNKNTKIVYLTDCHNKNPKQAIGKFLIDNNLVEQL